MSLRNRFLSIGGFTLLIAQTPSVSWAEETKDPASNGPITSKREAMKVIQDLNNYKQTQISRVFIGHGLIKATDQALHHADNAIESCKETHPDEVQLSEDLSAIHDDLHSQTDPILKKARKALNKTIQLEEILPAAQMKSILAVMDEDITKNSSKVEPEPITRLEDCQKFVKNAKRRNIAKTLNSSLNRAFGF
mgnify:CR=1 FL=1